MPANLWTPDEDAALITALGENKTYVEAAKAVMAVSGRAANPESAKRRWDLLEARRQAPPPKTKAAALSAQAMMGGAAAGKAGPPAVTLPGAPPNTDDLVAKLVTMTKGPPKRFEDVCNAMDLPPGKVRMLVEEAADKGFAVQLLDTHIGQPPEGPRDHEEATEIIIPQPGERHTLAIVGDLHYGNKHHLKAPFQDFCQKAYRAGARHFLQPGDFLDGIHDNLRWEQSHHGFEEQVAVACKELPQWKDATWYFITGNHDEYFRRFTGLDVGRAIVDAFASRGRKDIHYLGARGGYCRFRKKGQRRGLIVEMWHPGDKGNAYALSYRLQRKIDSLPPGAKPDLLIAGHWHQACYFPHRGVHAMSAGCWQGHGSAFGRSMTTNPTIGSWIIKWNATKEGTIRSFGQEWFSYYEKETVREVDLG